MTNEVAAKEAKRTLYLIEATGEANANDALSSIESDGKMLAEIRTQFDTTSGEWKYIFIYADKPKPKDVSPIALVPKENSNVTELVTK